MCLITIDAEIIKKIAFLARLKIDDNKVEPLRDELNSIFDWIKLLEEVDTDNVSPLTSVVDMELYQRADQVLEVQNRDDILANAPQKEEEFFVVPKVIE